MIALPPNMNASHLCASVLALTFLAAPPARSTEPSTELVISEGSYIGYATVADALATLKAQGFIALPALNGSVSFFDPDNKTTWTLTGKDDPAYPAAVRYVHTRSNGVAQVEITILCEASDGPCEKFRSEIRNNVIQISKMMAGDPSVKCWVNNDKIKCGAEPERKLSNQQIYVEVAEDGTCTVDNVATACLDVGWQIRAKHSSDEPRVFVCASASTKYDLVGKVMGALTDQHVQPAFGCASQSRRASTQTPP